MDIKKMKKNRDIEGLIGALKDENYNIRMDTAKVLEKIRDKRAMEPLKRALE